MKKYKLVLPLWFFGIGVLLAQSKYEREYRIRKSQFPEKALTFISEKLDDGKRLRFYKEIDSAESRYEAKFKKDRLWYGAEFSKEGVLKGIEIVIKPVDIPDDVFAKIEAHLESNFSGYKTRRLSQKYPVSASEPAETTIKNAFQNLMITNMTYELFIKGKKDGTRADFEIGFGSNGDFLTIKKALPANFDRILY